MKKRKAVALTLCAALLAVMAGCGSKDGIQTSSGKITYPEGGTYPLSCTQTLKVWGALTNENSGTIPLGQKWQENTGVKVEFIQPTGDYSEALSLLIASNDLPDVLMANFDKLPGGVQKYADDKVIIALDDYMESFAPNLSALYEQDTELAKIAKSDSGNYYMFPFIRGDEKLTVSYGPVVRKDILDKAGVGVPETIDEWHTALKVFRDNGMSAPLSYDLIDMERLSAAFFGAYGVKPNFYVENGSVHFGYLEPGAKDALANLNSWYEENLLDKNIAKVSELLDSNILNSQTGATVTYGSGGIGKYMRAAAANNDTEFNLVPAPFPVLNKGEVSKFGSKESRFNAMNNAFITTACNNIELAMRFLDYGYSEDGHMLLNFGIEGESYTMVDGYPTYTELITNNPDGLDFGKALGRYALTASGPFVQDVRYIEQAYSLPQQKQALTVWAATDADTYNLPRLTFTVDESQAINKAMNNINTLTDEMVLKFIMGIEPLENYDTFVSQLKSFGIESVLETYNAALARYEGR